MPVIRLEKGGPRRVRLTQYYATTGSLVDAIVATMPSWESSPVRIRWRGLAVEVRNCRGDCLGCGRALWDDLEFGSDLCAACRGPVVP